MKWFILCSALLLAVPASAQAPSVEFGIQGNLTNFNIAGQLEQIYGLGYGGGIHFDVNLGILSFRLTGDYITLSPDKDKYRTFLQQFIGGQAQQISIEGGRIDVFSAYANVKLIVLPLPIIRPYATAGGGLVNFGVSEAKVILNGTPLVNVPAVQSETKPALNVGAGVDIGLGGVDLYGEIKVVWVFTDPETTTQVPFVSIGLTF